MTAVSNATLLFVCVAMPAAIGTKVTTVPTLVPMDIDIKHAVTKSPGRIMLGGRMLSARLTVVSMAPMPLADCENAPARTYIHNIKSKLGVEAPWP